MQGKDDGLWSAIFQLISLQYQMGSGAQRDGRRQPFIPLTGIV